MTRILAALLISTLILAAVAADRPHAAAQETPDVTPSPTVAGPAPNADPPSQALDTVALVLIGFVTVVALSAGAAAVWRGTRG